MSNTTASEKIMDRVAALLRIAEHPNTPGPEAETALRQANSLITKHAIDEALLRQSQTISERRAISHATIVLGGGEFRPYLRTIFEVAAETLRVSVGVKYTTASGIREPEFHMYGAQEDVAWLDMLFNMIKLQFLTKLDPKWNESLGYDANVYNFKVAGFKWRQIDEIARIHGHESRESTDLVATIADEEQRLFWQRRLHWNNGYFITGDQVRKPNGFFHKMKAAYVRHAKAIGDDTRVKTQSHESYRLSFAEAFRARMTERFWDMQREAEATADTIPGAALALRDMRKDANEALWAAFPNMHPDEIKRREEAARAQAEAQRKAREDMLAAMTTEERQAFLEAEEAAERRAAKAQRAWERKNTRYYRYDSAAQLRGMSAADAVDLSRKAGSAGQGATRGSLN